MQQLFQDRFLEQVQLWLIAKETGFVHREVFEQSGKFLLSLTAGEQTIVAVEAVNSAGFQTALQSVLQKMDAALVKVHPALLIDERLQQLQFCFTDSNWNSWCGHEFSRTGFSKTNNAQTPT